MEYFGLRAVDLEVAPLLNALACQPQLWNAERLRTTYPGTPHGDISDILLRFADLPRFRVTGDIEVLMGNQPQRWYPAARVLPEAFPLVAQVMGLACAEQLGRVMVTKLPPGGHIAPHRDEGGYPQAYQRWQLPLQGDEGCLFRCATEAVTMRPGELWTFCAEEEHEVWNHGAVDRIVLIVDARPCAWGVDDAT